MRMQICRPSLVGKTTVTIWWVASCSRSEAQEVWMP